MKNNKRNIGQEILEAIGSIKAGKGKRFYVHAPEDIKQDVFRDLDSHLQRR